MTDTEKLNWYILDDAGSPVPVENSEEWVRWAVTQDHHIALDQIGNVQISTVFLGFDHSLDEGDPVLFETLISGGPNDGYQERYTRRLDAFGRHAELVAAERRRLIYRRRLTSEW